jgi:hypothetical protein
MPVVPDSQDDLSGTFSNYLWLAKKTTASGGVANASRQLEIWKLTGVVQTGDNSALSYVKIY